MQAVAITDPTLVSELLAAQPEAPGAVNKAARVYQPINLLLGHGSILTHPSGPLHRLVRKGIAPAFSAQNIRKTFPAFVSAANVVINMLVAAGPVQPKHCPSTLPDEFVTAHAMCCRDATVDMDNLLQRQSMDVIGKVAFGTNLGALRSLQDGSQGVNRAMDSLVRGLEEVVARMLNPLRWMNIFDKSVWRGAAACREFQAVMRQLLEDVRMTGPPSEDDTSVAAHLLRLKDPATGEPLPDAWLMAEMGVLFLAGFETTGHTMSWTLYLLSQHPAAEAKVADELDEAGLLARPGSPEPRQLQYDDISRLPYLGCVIKEAMRCLPAVAAGTMRHNAQPLRLGGHVIPADVALFVPFMANFSDPTLWDRADEFLPERWLEPDAEYVQAANHADGLAQRESSAATTASAADGEPQQPQSRQQDGAEASGGAGTHRTAWTREGTKEGKVRRFYPFSQGSRSCVGQALAHVNYTATLALLLGSFTFRLADEMGGKEGVRRRELDQLTLRPEGGMLMHAVPRLNRVF